jgi:DNA-binding GntR family transcriptional regulator
MRDAIECEAARMYCGKPIKDNYEYLMKKASELDSLSGELLEIWQSDLLFHQDLIKLSGCNVLVVEFKRMMHLSTFYQINSFLTNDERQERQSHCDLIDTLTIENPDHAENVIRDHLKSGKRKFLY